MSATDPIHQEQQAPASPPTPVAGSGADAATMLDEWLATLLVPIEGDEHGVGPDAQEDEAFQRIKAQVNSAWQVRGTDWAAVLTDSRRYVGETSKDLRVMAWLVYASLAAEDVGGLVTGLRLLDAFLERFGEHCHPTRPRGRATAIAWLAERLDGWLKQQGLQDVSLELLASASAAIDAADARLQDPASGVGGASSLAKIARLIREEHATGAALTPPPPLSAQTTPAAAKAGAPAPAATSTSMTSAPSLRDSTQAAPAGVGSEGARSSPLPGAPASTALEDESAFRSATQDGTSYIVALARFRRAQEPENPYAYKLLRNWLWGSLGAQVRPEALPPPNRPPNWQQLESAEGASKVLETAESMLPSSRFWLDINRHAWAALRRLAAHDSAAAVVSELRTFLQRYPQLVEASFRGGMALADAETRAWIADRVLVDPGEASLTTLAGGVDDATSKLLATARERAAEGEVTEALGLLEAALAAASTATARFELRSELASLLLDAAAPEVALAQLEALESQIAAHALEEWEPQRALAVAMLGRRLARQSFEDELLRERARAVVHQAEARIARCAPSWALQNRLTTDN
ncbi:MAG: type VI secretion system protein TssA [Pseudomonadota bacterium]